MGEGVTIKTRFSCVCSHVWSRWGRRHRAFIFLSGVFKAALRLTASPEVLADPRSGYLHGYRVPQRTNRCNKETRHTGQNPEDARRKLPGVLSRWSDMGHAELPRDAVWHWVACCQQGRLSQASVCRVFIGPHSHRRLVLSR